jgi:hypothetical protein
MLKIHPDCTSFYLIDDLIHWVKSINDDVILLSNGSSTLIVSDTSTLTKLDLTNPLNRWLNSLYDPATDMLIPYGVIYYYTRYNGGFKINRAIFNIRTCYHEYQKLQFSENFHRYAHSTEGEEINRVIDAAFKIR